VPGTTKATVKMFSEDLRGVSSIKYGVALPPLNPELATNLMDTITDRKSLVNLRHAENDYARTRGYCGSDLLCSNTTEPCEHK
jgi:hypothetical protein